MEQATSEHDTVRALHWDGDALVLLDQRVLPARVEHVLCRELGEVVAAIRDMVVRGAPAIGVAAAYAVVLAARRHHATAPQSWRADIEEDLAALEAARPTAVNLGWAVRRMRRAVAALDARDPGPVLLDEALAIHREDVAANRRMGELGAALIEQRCDVLTHCNAGSLATGGYGTALGVVRSAFEAGRLSRVFAGETRPWLQGARLTAWELLRDGIPVSLVADGAATYAMRQGGIGWVIVGADRVAANGDVANKIGTYSLAVSARFHGVRFMVVAPCSTIDLDCPDGAGIPIEHRPAGELLGLGSARHAAPGADAWNPVFDVTPAALVDALVTERGVVERPDESKIRALFGDAGAPARASGATPA